MTVWRPKTDRRWGKYSHLPAAFSNMLNDYKQAAKRANRSFDLTIDQLYSIVMQNCHYCGQEPQERSNNRQGGAITANGIDRKDNSIGYTVENSLPCCAPCNRAKYKMTYEEYKEHLYRLWLRLDDIHMNKP